MAKTLNWQEYRDLSDRIERFKAREREKAVVIKRPRVKDMVDEARVRVTPRVVNNLIEIANNPKRSTALRVKAANHLLKIGYGEPEDNG